MLANTYKEIDTSKITVTKPEHADYCALEAASFLEPKGMHIFSIHNLPLYKNSTPIFKTNPLTVYLTGVAVDKTTNKVSTSTDVLSEAHKRLSFIPGNYIARYDSIDLIDLQTKMYKTFASHDQAGIVAFRSKINVRYYYGFRLAKDSIKIKGKEKLVVKLVAKIPQGLSLKAICTCSELLTSGFLLKNNTHSTEAKGTNKWEAYTFVIDNKYANEGYLESLVFYIGRTNSSSETDTIDISISQYDKYVYLCYTDFLMLPKNYTQLEQYSPMENTTRVKGGNFENTEFFEECRLNESIDLETEFKHDIVLKQKAPEPVLK